MAFAAQGLSVTRDAAMAMHKEVMGKDFSDPGATPKAFPVQMSPYPAALK